MTILAILMLVVLALQLLTLVPLTLLARRMAESSEETVTLTRSLMELVTFLQSLKEQNDRAMAESPTHNHSMTGSPTPTVGQHLQMMARTGNPTTLEKLEAELATPETAAGTPEMTPSQGGTDPRPWTLRKIVEALSPLELVIPPPPEAVGKARTLPELLDSMTSATPAMKRQVLRQVYNRTRVPRPPLAPAAATMAMELLTQTSPNSVETRLTLTRTLWARLPTYRKAQWLKNKTRLPALTPEEDQLLLTWILLDKKVQANQARLVTRRRNAEQRI